MPDKIKVGPDRSKSCNSIGQSKNSAFVPVKPKSTIVIGMCTIL